MKVLAVRESEWKKDDGTTVKVTTLTLEGHGEVPGYDLPSVPEVGKPLPDGWEIATAKSGKLYIKVPKPSKGGYGGGAAAYRNTKEGQAYEQERMDRRTALMQAVALRATGQVGDEWDDLALTMYAWLRETSGGAAGRSATERSPAPSPGEPSGPVGEGVGEAPKPAGSDSSCPDCGSTSLTGFKPDETPLPAGMLRCTECGTVTKEKR